MAAAIRSGIFIILMVLGICLFNRRNGADRKGGWRRAVGGLVGFRRCPFEIPSFEDIANIGARTPPGKAHHVQYRPEDILVRRERAPSIKLFEYGLRCTEPIPEIHARHASDRERRRSPDRSVMPLEVGGDVVEPAEHFPD